LGCWRDKLTPFNMGGKGSKAAGDGALDEGSDFSLMRLTSIEELGSQGTIVSADGTVAMVHASTTPPNYYRSKYDISGGINMDRGGFGRHADGTNVAVVFDGVSAGGKRNAYAAQAFARSTLTHLVSHKRAFTSQVTGNAGPPGNQPLPTGIARTAPVVELFGAALDQSNNPGEMDPRFEAEGGAATGAIVTFALREGQPPKPELLLVGAALGDAAVIVVEPDQAGAAVVARQLNLVERAGGRADDSGGQLNMCMGISGTVLAFAQPIHPDSLVLVTTDGLTDNLPTKPSEAATLLPLLMRCTLLNNPVPGEGLTPATGGDAEEEKNGLGIPGAAAVMRILCDAYNAADEEEDEDEDEEEKMGLVLEEDGAVAAASSQTNISTLDQQSSVYLTPRQGPGAEDADEQHSSVYFTPAQASAVDDAAVLGTFSMSTWNACSDGGGLSGWAQVIAEPRLVGLRLQHYVEWVTRRLYASEQAYFGEEAQYHALLRQRAAVGATRYEEEADNDRPPAPIDQQITASQAKLQEMIERQRAGPRVGPGKTDDALMIVMRPRGEVV
jgi:serine/threonine protein phosphatase PrpC